jgi:hypothetical protein
MTDTMTATVNPQLGYVLIGGTWGTSLATYVQLIRVVGPLPAAGLTAVAPSALTVIRGHGAVNPADGIGQPTSGNTAFWFDTECPLDVSVTYVAIDNVTNGYITAGPVVLGSAGNLWLRDPIMPANNQRITVDIPTGPDPDCLPVSGIFFLPTDVESHPSNSIVQQVDNAALPITAARPRSGISSTQSFVTRTFVDRDNLLDLAASGSPLMFQANARFGLNDQYLNVTDVPTTRGLTDQSRQWRIMTMPYTETQRPAGLSYGVLGARYRDLCGIGTFTQALSAGYTWLQAAEGALAPASGIPQFETGADTAADYPLSSTLTGASIQVVDGSFETGFFGFTATNGTVAASTAHNHSGGHSMTITTTGTPTFTAARTPVNVIGGQLYMVMFWAFSLGGYANTAIQIDWLRSGGSLISSSTITAALPANNYQQYAMIAEAPPTAVQCFYGMYMNGSPPTGQQMSLDDCNFWPVNVTYIGTVG